MYRLPDRRPGLPRTRRRSSRCIGAAAPLSRGVTRRRPSATMRYLRTITARRRPPSRRRSRSCRTGTARSGRRCAVRS